MADMTGSGGLIARVREGMRVVDSDGEEVGSVAEVRMSDPGVVTTQGEAGGAGDGILGILADTFAGDGGVPEQARERLVRLGYVRVDAAGLFSGNRYVAADEIASVSEDTVHLSVPGSRLVG